MATNGPAGEAISTIYHSKPDERGRTIRRRRSVGRSVDWAHKGRVMDSYEVRRKLGAGAYGSVYLASHRATGRAVVVKAIKTAGMSARERSDVTQEVKVLSQLRHRNIVEYRDSFADPRTE